MLRKQSLLSFALLMMLSACGGGGSSSSGNGNGSSDGNEDPVDLWTWVSGNDLINQAGDYGTQGVPDAANIPVARSTGSSSWIDLNGDFWLFGGSRYNDLRRWDGNDWTWVSGADVAGQFGSYGIKNTADMANVPGARNGGVSWSDGTNIWLYGGNGRDGAGVGALTDLWRYQP